MAVSEELPDDDERCINAVAGKMVSVLPRIAHGYALAGEMDHDGIDARSRGNDLGFNKNRVSDPESDGRIRRNRAVVRACHGD